MADDSRARPESRSPITLKVKFKSTTVDQFIERYAVDVSHGGIFIRTKDPLAIGTHLKFEFQLQDASPLLTGDGTVVWIREHDPDRSGVAPGMGVRFDRLSPPSQQVLAKILAYKKEAAANEARAESLGENNTPTRVGPAPTEESARGIVASPSSPSGSRPMPLASGGSDEWSNEVFEQPTRVTALTDLAKAAEASAQSESPAAGLFSDFVGHTQNRPDMTSRLARSTVTMRGAVPPPDLVGSTLSSADDTQVSPTAVTRPGANDLLLSLSSRIDAELGEGFPTEPGPAPEQIAAALESTQVDPAPASGVKQLEDNLFDVGSAADVASNTGTGVGNKPVRPEELSVAAPRPSATMQKVGAKTATVQALPPPPQSDAAASNRKKTLLLAAAGVVLVISAAAIIVSRGGKKDKTETPVAPVNGALTTAAATTAPVSHGSSAPVAAVDAGAAVTGISVQFTSTPAGATVTAAGEVLGTTPFALTGKEAGATLAVEIRLPLYRAEKRDVVIAADGKVDVALTPLDRELTIRTVPAGATVFLDGKKLGRAPVVIPKFDVSRSQELKATLIGYEEFTETLALSGAPWSEEGELVKLTRDVALSKSEAAATIPRIKKVRNSQTTGASSGTGPDASTGDTSTGGDTPKTGGATTESGTPNSGNSGTTSGSGGEEDHTPEWMKNP